MEIILWEIHMIQVIEDDYLLFVRKTRGIGGIYMHMVDKKRRQQPVLKAIKR